jgi:hypothetical protein
VLVSSYIGKAWLRQIIFLCHAKQRVCRESQHVSKMFTGSSVGSIQRTVGQVPYPCVSHVAKYPPHIRHSANALPNGTTIYVFFFHRVPSLRHSVKAFTEYECPIESIQERCRSHWYVSPVFIFTYILQILYFLHSIFISCTKLVRITMEWRD